MKLLPPLFSIILLFTIARTQAQELEPGVYRWAIKTSVVSGATVKKSTLDDLLTLPDPVDHASEVPAKTRITKTIDGFKEGNIITITGWRFSHSDPK